MQWQGYGQAKDNSSTLTTPALVRINSGTSTIDAFKDWTGASWTSSGSKALQAAMLMYEAA
jgi:hypothetical protein